MKSISCRDMGTDCDFVATGMTEDEVMKQVGEHGKQVHAMTDADFTPEMMAKAKAAMKDA